VKADDIPSRAVRLNLYRKEKVKPMDIQKVQIVLEVIQTAIEIVGLCIVCKTTKK
jgi:hypothetical protein